MTNFQGAEKNFLVLRKNIFMVFGAKADKVYELLCKGEED